MFPSVICLYCNLGATISRKGCRSSNLLITGLFDRHASQSDGFDPVTAGADHYLDPARSPGGVALLNHQAVLKFTRRQPAFFDQPGSQAPYGYPGDGVFFQADAKAKLAGF